MRALLHKQLKSFIKWKAFSIIIILLILSNLLFSKNEIR